MRTHCRTAQKHRKKSSKFIKKIVFYIVSTLLEISIQNIYVNRRISEGIRSTV